MQLDIGLLASISCTIPIFIVVVAQAFSLSTVNGLVNFASYGLGMTAMMIMLSLVMSVSKQAIKRYFQPVMRVMQPLSAVVLIGGRRLSDLLPHLTQALQIDLLCHPRAGGDPDL